MSPTRVLGTKSRMTQLDAMTSQTPACEPSSEHQAPQVRERRTRRLDLDRAKGLTIILVVLGHIYDPQQAAWATTLRYVLYAFHMPFFMYISGYTFIYSGGRNLRGGPVTYILARANRLLVPFFVMATIIIASKFGAGFVMLVNKAVSDVLTAFSLILFNTEHSPVLSIWYLFVLFVYVVVSPLLIRYAKTSLGVLFAVSLLMYVYYVVSFYTRGGMSDAFYLDRIFMYYVFFVAGCVAAERAEAWDRFVAGAWVPALLLFVVLDGLLLHVEYRYLFVGLASMPALHGLVRSRFFGDDRVLLFFAKYTLIISLLNTLIIGVVRGVMGRFVVPSQHTLLLILCSFPVGLLGPILVRRLLGLFPPGRVIARWTD